MQVICGFEERKQVDGKERPNHVPRVHNLVSQCSLYVQTPIKTIYSLSEMNNAAFESLKDKNTYFLL